MRSFDPTSFVVFGDSLSDNGNLFALTEFPPLPYFEGRFSNGPVYAEIVPALFGVPEEDVLNFAFGGAEAVTQTTDSAQQAAINLTAQLERYQASGAGAGAHDAAIINIGSNDFLRFSGTPAQALGLAFDVVSNVARAAHTLVQGGIETLIFMNLPNATVTPLGQSLSPAEQAATKQLLETYNAGLKLVAGGFALGGVDVKYVDVFRFSNEVATDKETFGISDATTPWLITNAAGIPIGFNKPTADGLAFIDGVHPTAETHETQAAFVEATLRADSVRLFDVGSNVVIGGFGDDLVLTGVGADRIEAGFGDDVVLAGAGEDVVNGGLGTDVLSGGGGNDKISGGLGSDLLAGNRGDDMLDGGLGDDVLIAGGGRDSLSGGLGNDVFIVSESDGPAAGTYIDGGLGRDLLRISMTQASYESGSFLAGLTWKNVERIEIDLSDGDTIVLGGAAGPFDGAVDMLLAKADLWGFIG
jgi:phospholipase/lecithinase/hemolysin